MPAAIYLTEKDIRCGLEKGGNIRGCFLVVRLTQPRYEFQPYIRPSWNKAHLPLRTWAGKDIRTYKDVGRLVQLVREDFGFMGSIPIHFPRTAELVRFKFLLSEDVPPAGMRASSQAMDD